MAITERFENDKIEVVGSFKHVQVRRATVERDGVEINRSFHRYVFQPGTLGESDALVDTDILGKMLMFKPSVLLSGLMQLKKHGDLS